MNYERVPVSEMAEGMRYYMEYGFPPGSFLQALLENDLMEACRRADGDNQKKFYEWARWLHTEAPVGSYGSRKNVEVWMIARRNEHKEQDDEDDVGGLIF